MIPRKAPTAFTLIELLVVIAIIGILSAVVLASLGSANNKGRDAARVSEMRQIKYALELYYDDNGNYPTCLYPGGSCTTTLQGTKYMKTVPVDPLSGLGYTYAALGAGASCSSYHLGVSLEMKTNPALLDDSDGAPRPICTNSPPDFSGISFAVGGQQCNTTAGTPQPTNAANGGTCYDIVP